MFGTMRRNKNASDDSESSDASETEQKTRNSKRGPGRPCKVPKKNPIPRAGISKQPTGGIDHHIEMIYDKPLILKRIFQFYKQLATIKVQIIFRPTEIIFYSVDHHEKSKTYIRIDANKINHYYCRSELDIGVSSKDVELILNTVDKEYGSIIMISNVQTTQKNITIVLENDICADEIHTVDLIGQYDRCVNESEFLDENYMISFRFPGHFFKKTINDIKTFTDQMSITQEDKNKPLMFEFLTKNKKIHTHHKFKNSSKIGLVSHLQPNDSFRIDIKLDYIKPISSAQISDEICILVDENKKFMTISFIDEDMIEIKTLTEIIDERPM
jgi:hypothetical protein